MEGVCHSILRSEEDNLRESFSPSAAGHLGIRPPDLARAFNPHLASLVSLRVSLYHLSSLEPVCTSGWSSTCSDSNHVPQHVANPLNVHQHTNSQLIPALRWFLTCSPSSWVSHSTTGYRWNPEYVTTSWGWTLSKAHELHPRCTCFFSCSFYCLGVRSTAQVNTIHLLSRSWFGVSTNIVGVSNMYRFFWEYMY